MVSEIGLPAEQFNLTGERRQLLSRRIQLFVGATITYNVIEAIIALGEGARVSSTALVGFGLDSVIEVSSAAAVAWQFSAKDPQAREKVALRIIAFSFFGLASYVTVDAVRSLFGIGEVNTRPSVSEPRRCQPGCYAGAVVGSAAHRPRTRLTLCGRGLQTGTALHLPIGRVTGGAAPEQSVGLVLGRSDRCPCHRSHCSQGGHQRVERRHLLPRASSRQNRCHPTQL
jgi:hypothetical protein